MSTSSCAAETDGDDSSSPGEMTAVSDSATRSHVSSTGTAMLGIAIPALALASLTHTRHRNGLRHRSMANDRAGGGADDDENSTSSAPEYNGTNSEPSGTYDEYGLSLSTDAARPYAMQQVMRRNKEHLYAHRIDAMLDDDITRLRDKSFISTVMLGIPARKRRDLWLLMSGVDLRMLTERDYYHKLEKRLRAERDSAVARSDVDQIDKDLHRTHGATIRRDRDVLKQRMRRILLLYAMHRPDQGYCQAFNYFVMSFIILDFTDEEAFWMLDHITMNLFPHSFSANIIGQRADVDVFQYYFAKTFPDLQRFLKQHDVSICEVAMSAIFGKLLCDKMPYESTWCVWDLMFAGGAVEFFNALLKIFVFVDRSLPRRHVAPISPTPAPAPTKKRSFIFWKRTASDGAVGDAAAAAAAAADTLSSDAAVAEAVEATPKMEIDLEICNAMIRINHLIQSIVNVPELLATTKLAEKIDARSLAMRRNKYRLHYYRREVSQKKTVAANVTTTTTTTPTTIADAGVAMASLSRLSSSSSVTIVDDNK